MKVSTTIRSSISNTSSIGARSPHNIQEAVPLPSTARITRLMPTGGGRTDTIPILGGPFPFSSSHGRRRHHLLVHKISRRNSGKESDHRRRNVRLPLHRSISEPDGIPRPLRCERLARASLGVGFPTQAPPAAVGMAKAWSSEGTIGVDLGIKNLCVTRAVTTRKRRRHSLTERRFKKKTL